MQSLLGRIAVADREVQAWETLDAERAIRRAIELESQPTTAPLYGIPFGVKDIFLTEGVRTSAGFGPLEGFRPDSDAEAVRRLRESGAILLGKTVTTQFAMQDPPRTRNPWDTSRTPGGSSSGSAAATGGFMIPLALGSQTKGSVLRPAAYCGAVGLKPTFGRISRRGVFPLAWSFDHVGLICRSVRDAALALDVLAGHDPEDPLSARKPVDEYSAAVGSRGDPPRLGLISEFFDAARPATRDAVHKAASELESHGARLVELRLPESLDLILAIHDLVMHSEIAAVHHQSLPGQETAYGPKLRITIEAGGLVPASAYLHAQRLRRRIRSRIEPMLSQVDALLTPTVSDVAPGPETTGDASLQAPWSQFGLPAISLPIGLDASGLPLALQLATRRFEESSLLATARWVERVLLPMPLLPES